MARQPARPVSSPLSQPAEPVYWLRLWLGSGWPGSLGQHYMHPYTSRSLADGRWMIRLMHRDSRACLLMHTCWHTCQVERVDGRKILLLSWSGLVSDRVPLSLQPTLHKL